MTPLNPCSRLSLPRPHHYRRRCRSALQMLDDIERAVDDGVNSYKLLGRDARAVPAGGATEIEIAHQLQQWGRKVGAGAWDEWLGQGRKQGVAVLGRDREGCAGPANSPSRLPVATPSSCCPSDHALAAREAVQRPSAHQRRIKATPWFRPPAPPFMNLLLPPPFLARPSGRRLGWTSTRLCDTQRRWRWCPAPSRRTAASTRQTRWRPCTRRTRRGRRVRAWMWRRVRGWRRQAGAVGPSLGPMPAVARLTCQPAVARCSLSIMLACI